MPTPSEELLLSATFGRDTQPAGTALKLKETDAIEIWIARWLRVPLKSLTLRYGCDSRRLYEIWWGERFPGSRSKAETAFRTRYPALADRTSYGYRRIPRVVPKDGQLGFFE